MTLKKIQTISIFGTFILCFITHFLYSLFPNFVFSIFFPVNESVWEHMKMITSSILIWRIIEYFILSKNHIKYNNYLFSTFIMCLLSIIIFLTIYYPIYSMVGESFILNVICLFITIYFVNVIGYKIMISKNVKYGNIFGILGIIIMYLAFTYLTYFPIKNELFLDQQSNTYGINP